MYSSLTMRIARWSSYTHILFFKLFSIIGLFYKTLTTVNLCCSLHIYFVLDRKKVLNLKLNSMKYWKNNRGSWETNPIRITREQSQRGRSQALQPILVISLGRQGILFSFGVIVNGLISVVYLAESFLLVYRNETDFYTVCVLEPYWIHLWTLGLVVCWWHL